MRLPTRFAGLLLLLYSWGISSSTLGASRESGALSETWDAIFINGQKVGFVHSVSDRVDAGGTAVIRTQQETEMTTLRFGNKMTMRVNIDSFERPDGRLYAIDARTKMATMEQSTMGRLGADGKFSVTVRTPGASTEQTIDWSKEIHGPYAHERSLREKPMEPGETRTFLTFLPELNKVTKRTLVAMHREKTELLDKSTPELLLVRDTNDALDVEGFLWLDESGNILKSSVSLAGLPMVGYRVTEAEARGDSTGVPLDLGIQTLVRPDKSIPNAHVTRAVTYRLELGDQAAADSIPSAGYQKVLRRDGTNVWIQVRRDIPRSGAENPKVGNLDEFLASNGFIQSDDPEIVATAKRVAGDAVDPWDKVTLLERWVDDNMVNRDFSIGFATASEVMKTKQGDCTEHAVLLAALCRAIGVPARVAMGLVYLEGAGEFGYHMWTEVHLHGEWYALDGTLGKGGIGGGHIKLADGSLKGASAMSTFLPIFKVIGKLKIHVEKVE